MRQDNPAEQPNDSDALRRRASKRSLLVAVVVAALAAPWLPVPAVAVFTGGACGVANLWMTARSADRLLNRRSVGGFVLSSFGRIALFGIVPVTFAAVGPWWSMAWYFAGFFLPLAMFAYGARRSFT